MIKAIKNTFNYLFYRAYCFYVKYKDDDAVFMATMIVAMIQVLWLIACLALLDHAIREDRHSRYMHHLLKRLIAVITVVAIIINYRWFRNADINAFREKWDTEPESVRMTKGWLIVILLILPILYLVGYGVLKHNFKVI